MEASVPASVLSSVLRLLPRPLLAALDAWSHRVAQRRARQRQQKWLQRQAAAGK